MKKLSGVLTAVVTPFNQNKVDFISLEKILKHQISFGIDGFILNGTTGESPTLSEEEVKEIFHFVKKKISTQTPVIVGTGSNSTEKTIELTKKAEKMGADAALIVVPYYNKPPQRGLFEHFKAIAEQTNIPIILYNVPSRTVTSLELETIKKLSKLPNIIGIKEATGDIEFAKKIRQTCGNEFLLLSGDDGSYDEFAKVGGDGVISVASHIIPSAMKEKRASEYRTLIDLLFCESNPIPVKMALFMMGLIQSPELRLPLVAMSEQNKEKLKLEMKIKGIL